MYVLDEDGQEFVLLERPLLGVGSFLFGEPNDGIEKIAVRCGGMRAIPHGSGRHETRLSPPPRWQLAYTVDSSRKDAIVTESEHDQNDGHEHIWITPPMSFPPYNEEICAVPECTAVRYPPGSEQSSVSFPPGSEQSSEETVTTGDAKASLSIGEVLAGVGCLVVGALVFVAVFYGRAIYILLSQTPGPP